MSSAEMAKPIKVPFFAGKLIWTQGTLY